MNRQKGHVGNVSHGQKTSVFRNKKECHPKDNKNVKKKRNRKEKKTNEISYLGNVSHEQ